MKIIENNSNHELIINKSKFIGYLYKISNLEDINNYLEIIKNKYKDATHICYAYILDNKEKAYDNGEPQGTAGIPILDILKKNELDHVLAIVIRYFGGIKLGANGLIHAYSDTIKETLLKTNIIELKKGYIIKIKFTYENTNLINKIIDSNQIINKEFNQEINYLFKGDNNILKELDNINQKYEIIEETYL